MSLPSEYLDEFTEPAGYVDFASTGPVSRRVRSAVDGLMGMISSPSAGVSSEVFPRYEAALAVMARFMDVTPDRVAPLATTSPGIFHAAFGLLGSGGNVVVPSHEFPANLYPWLRAAAAGGPEVRMIDIPDGRVTPERISEATDSETRAVAVSLVDYQTGFRVDLDGMREAAGDALLVVDAIQGLGAFHRGIGPADVMVAGGQKWMRAGWGSGVMAVSDRALERLAPTLSGWLAVEDAFDTSRTAPHPPLASAGRFQQGTPPIVGAFQFAAAVEVAELVGVPAIADAVADRVAAMEEVVRSAGAEVRTPWRGPSERAGILCFRFPEAEPAATHTHLAEAGIAASHRGSWVRLSPHASTSPDAIGLLAGALGVGD
ncbi:MAG: aminotransferase class V-fold PLP-dependent enzyme [Acidimicrobiia bacterium]|nr:aminotransferase class V-fold PLP-dependent enzyme [Acidimicrobiia bacterium]